MSIHNNYIKRCLEIAKNGLGNTRPNPMVGSVIVHKNKIIGEGFTSPFGGNHAEVNAINSVYNKTLLKESTIYVTLEPCSHFGKTPPCSDLIIAHKIPNVVIGCVDENEKVSGRGIQKLRDAGCNVTVGILENDCKKHHKRFFTYHNKKRPYIILKWAETSNGYIAPITKHTKKPVWITNFISRQLVHKWRAEEQAILVGTNTVLEDNPTLTTRDWAGTNPIRVVIDANKKLQPDMNVFCNEAKTITITNKEVDFSKPVAQQICDYLFKQNINSIIIEGGAKTIQTFVNENIWDEARVFKGQKSFTRGIEAPKFKGKLILEKTFITDTLKIYKND